MNTYLKLLILLGINALAFKIAGFWPGIICLAIVIYKVLSMFGITRNPSLFRGSFVEGITFTKDYFGPYSQNYKAFQDALTLIRNYQLKDFFVIAIYYDKPGSVEESKMRSSIGIYKKNKGFPDKVSDELERYCAENGYNYNELPSCTSLYSSWDYSNMFTMMLGIKKFYSLLEKKLKDTAFKKSFRIKEEEIKVTIELYDSDTSMSFYVPLLNASKFLVFKKDK